MAKFDATYLAKQPPPYPPSARRRGIEGTVIVEAKVGLGGDAKDVKLAVSAGDEALDRAAIEAVRNWRFIPPGAASTCWRLPSAPRWSFTSTEGDGIRK